MKSESNARILAALRWYTQAASLIVMGISLMVLAGWMFNVALFKSFLPNLPAIRFNTALSIFLLGVSLWFLRNEETSLAKKRIGQLLAGLVLLFNLLTLSEYLFGWDLGIDQLFVHDLNNLPDPYPGRIAPLAILAVGLSSLSLLWLGSRISRVFSYALATVSFLIILNNLFNFQVPLSQTERIYVPLHAGLAFLMLALGLIMARPTSELMEALISKLPGSRAMRSLLFGIVTLTTLFAWLVEGGERAGILDSSKESMLLVILLILAYSPLIYFVARDINQAETKLMLSDQILERVNALVLVADVQGSISYISPSVKTMLGFEPSELLGEGWWKISRPNSAQGIAEKERLLAVVNQNQPLNPAPYESEIQDRWGNQHWIMWVDALGPDSSIIGVGHDITDRKKMEDALRTSERELRALSDALEQRVVERTSDLYRVNLELERASHAKDEFLAVMSHELRTPLNSILGFSEILLEQVRGPLNDYQEKSLRIVEASGQHLLTLINEILDLSRIEAGKLELHPEPVDVSQLCETGLAFVREQAHQKSIALLFEPMPTGHMISGDPRFLKQILVNLLSNAVKFTPDNGQVTLEVTTDAEKGLLQFSVSDTGIGIAPADLSRLFQPFVQVDSRLNRQFGGTGLGLALVQRLTDLHGGSVHVQTEVGKGSRFTIILPWQPDSRSQPAMAGETTDVPNHVREVPTSVASEKRVDRGLILLAEDNPANLLTIGDYLESKDFRVVVAHNGMEAIARAAEISPDIILMDIQMPVMDGLEATRRLRADPRFGSVPIVALTALAMHGDRERCLEAGATEYLSKPVDLKNLVKMLNSLLGYGE